MSFNILRCGIRFVHNFTFVIVVSVTISICNFLLLVSMVLIALLLSCIEFFKNLQSLFFFHIIVMHKF
jgi:hypothetical protein